MRRNESSTILGTTAVAATVIVALVVLVLLMTGCGSNDVSVSGRETSPAFKVSMPDHFGTVARKCDGPNMIYETENGGTPGRGAFAVVANDPRCDKGRTP